MKSRVSSGAAWSWGVVGALSCAVAATFEPSMLEEGLLLHVAQRLLRGERLYRDVVFFTGPLPFELLSLLFRYAGENLALARGVVVVLQGLATASVFAIARRAGTGPIAHSAAAIQASTPWLLFPLFSIYFPTTLATLLAPLAVYAAVRGLASNGWAVLAGVLSACAALCKQTTGAVMAVGLVAVIAAWAPPGRRLAASASLIAGGLATALATVLFFLAQGTAGDLFESTVWMPFTLGDTFQMPFPALWPPGVLGTSVQKSWPYYLPRLYLIAKGEPGVITRNIGLVTQALYALPLAALAATVARALFGRLPAAAALHASALLALTAGLFPRTDWGHLSMALPAAAVQLILVAGARGATGLRDGFVRRLLAGLLVTGFGAATVTAALLIDGAAAPRPWDERVPVRPVSDAYTTPAVPRVIGYLRERLRPGEPIFIARQEPLLYFILGARNPTRYVGMMQGLRERQERELLAALPDVRYLVMSENDEAATGYYADELPQVEAHLERHYRIAEGFPTDVQQWLQVYERADDRGATALDLNEAAPQAPHWLNTSPKGPVIEYPASRLPRFAMRHLRRPLPVMVAPDGGGVDFNLEIPERARFQADVGLGRVASSEGMLRREAGETYSVLLLHDGATELLSSVRLPPDPQGERTWQPIEADLSRWAGQRVVLRLQVVPDKSPKPVSMAWWGSPRIAVSVEPNASTPGLGDPSMLAQPSAIESR